MENNFGRSHIPPFEIRLRVLAAVDFAPGKSIRERIVNVSKKSFRDETTNKVYKFTWRTISTWLYRYKKGGVTSLDKKTRADKNSYRKIKPNELAEAIQEVEAFINPSKTGALVKLSIYRALQKKGLISRSQLSQTSFYRMVRENNLLSSESRNKKRLSFSMQYANEMWQADTMYGPSIKQSDGKWKKTFLIAFIDDASRVITHAQFFYHDNTINMIEAFRTALYKRGKPDRLYFDNGSNYTSKEILQASARLNIIVSHAPIRDGSAKGKIERFFRGFRDRFLTENSDFDTIDKLNEKTQEWIEKEYNSKYHSGIQMIPVDRFNLDSSRIKYLTEDQFSDEVFFCESDRKVGPTNILKFNSKQYEAPVDLRGKKVQIRYHRNTKDRVVVYYKEKRMGDAALVNLYKNSAAVRKNVDSKRYKGDKV